MSAITDRLTDDDIQWLARTFRMMQARHLARLERERAERERAERERAEGERADDETRAGGRRP